MVPCSLPDRDVNATSRCIAALCPRPPPPLWPPRLRVLVGVLGQGRACRVLPSVSTISPIFHSMESGGSLFSCPFPVGHFRFTNFVAGQVELVLHFAIRSRGAALHPVVKLLSFT